MQGLLLWSMSALAWVEMGPEKGHILDADISPEHVYVTTRVGVLRATLQMDDWERWVRRRQMDDWERRVRRGANLMIWRDG